MENIYYGVAVFVYSLFIVRFILSWIGGDFEIDSDADLDISDVVSFKGLTHFMMGLSGWLSVKSLVSTVQWYDYIIAVVIGCIFVVMLYYVYKLMLKLESKPTILSEKQLIGKSAKVYLHVDYNKYIITVNNGVGTTEVLAHSSSKHNIGDMVTILDYKDSYYIIK